MDPLSLAANIAGVVQLAGVIIGYLNNLKDASADRARCAVEVSNVSSLLVALIYRLDEASSSDDWHTQVQALAAANGPIDQYRSALEQLRSKLTSTAPKGLKKIGSALTWNFSKEEVTSILAKIERLKSLTQIALEMDHFKLSQALKNDTTVIKTAVRSLQDSQESQRYRVTTDWLSSTDFPAQQSDSIGRRQEGTGLWFLASPEFTNWLQGSKQILFCPGIPGAGKTMIAAIAVDHVWKASQGDNVGVAYVYCNYKRRETQTAIDLLAAVLKQLVQERPLYGEPVATLHNRHADRGTRPSLDEIRTALNSVISKYSKVYIIIDALDECTDSDGTRSNLLSILRNLETKTDTSLMVTSRFVARIEQLFQGSPMLVIRASDADVNRFVAGQMDRLPKCVQRDPELQTEIQDGIVLAVDGMFLLARLHVDSLQGKMTKKAIRSTLEKLPKGSAALNKAYDEAIERIESQLPEESELAKNVLSWITYAERHLTTKEICHALAVEIGESELDEDNIPDIEDVISVCAGLVAVDEGSDIIRLVHYTTQEYFELVREAWNPKAQEMIASTCLTYLSFETFDTGQCYSDVEFHNRIAQNPFLVYVAWYWGNHALPVQQTIKNLALPFLRNKNKVSCSGQVMFVHDSGGVPHSRNVPMKVTGAHVAAYFGMVYLLQELIHGYGDENCMSIDAADLYGRTPLSRAAARGHTAAVELLVEQEEVEADSKDDDHLTPLLWAVKGGHEAVVKLLVERDDVEADSTDSRGQTSLSWAAMSGHEAIVKLLVKRSDVEADSMDYVDLTPLSWAAREGHGAVVKLLVERDDVEADSKDNIGRTPLLWAAWEGSEAVVKLFVERGDVEADSKDDNGDTPLSLAAILGHEAVVKLLVERGDVEADSKDNIGRTPLMWAAWEGHEAIVKLLVERGDVEADSKDDDDNTPLSLAAQKAHEAIVKLLLKGGDVEADYKDFSGQTPLSWASRRHGEVVKLLVERDDVEADSKDNDGRTPLSWAALSGQEANVKLLLDQGVEADVKDNDGQTPLSLAAENGHEATVKLFLEWGVEADSMDNGDSTPLMWAVKGGHEEVVKLLVERDDVDADSKDFNGRTPLLQAAVNRHEALLKQRLEALMLLSYSAARGDEATVKFLLEREGLEADYKNKGQTPLSRAAQNGQEAIVKLLLKWGVEADSTDNDDNTPLIWAATGGHERVVKLLLESDDVKVDSKDHDGRTALWWAAGKGHEAVTKLLVERGDADLKDNSGVTPLSWAAVCGQEAIVKLLLNQGVDADAKDEDGQTPLSRAAEDGQEEVVKLLLEWGVEADSTDNDGNTPLMWAAKEGHEAVVKLLVAQDDVEADFKNSPRKQTPLWWAADRGHEAVVKLLVERGDVDADSKDFNGWTPILQAALNGHDAVVKLLLEHGVDPNSKDIFEGLTLLSWAAARGHEATVRLLLERDDVEADYKDNNGRMALSLAASMGHEAIVTLLLKRSDVEADSTDNIGLTPLMWATGQGEEATMKLLERHED